MFFCQCCDRFWRAEDADCEYLFGSSEPVPTCPECGEMLSWFGRGYEVDFDELGENGAA